MTKLLGLRNINAQFAEIYEVSTGMVITTHCFSKPVVESKEAEVTSLGSIDNLIRLKTAGFSAEEIKLLLKE